MADQSSFQYCKVFPPIGVARLGNSSDPDGYFVGPEVPDSVPHNRGSYKDAQGRVKRQAARFRVYGFDAKGHATELTAAHPEVESIEWHVTLCNKKAEWWQFGGTQRVADLLGGKVGPRLRRRNELVQGAHRKGLIIGPVSGSICGADSANVSLDGQFQLPGLAPRNVHLGDLATDSNGRLLVLGGQGISESLVADNPLSHYANNDGWYDDVSDGPVTVEIKLKGGRTLTCRSRAWVLVVPPHFSPHTKNIVTLWDVMSEVALEHKLAWPESELGPKPTQSGRVSFAQDVYPILERLVMYKWVSDRARRGHGAGKRGDFLNPDLLRELADPAKARLPDSLPKYIWSRLRTPILHPPLRGTKAAHAGLLDPKSQAALNQANLSYMPPLAGDEGDVRHAELSPVEDEDGVSPPQTWLSVTETQYWILTAWKDGEFVNDWNPQAVPRTRSFDEIPPANQPRALTIAALEACQGGAFFPGIEITSICRFKDTYEEAFRITNKYEAGDISKWMALPWQADFYECRDHWWPSVRPDDVIPVGEYEQIIGEFEQEAEQGRLETLLNVRKPWTRGLGLALPKRPDLPDSEPSELPATYYNRCREKLKELKLRYVDRAFPEPLDNELGDVYRRRVEEFLDKTILETSEFTVPPLKDGELLEEFMERIQKALHGFLESQIVPPSPNAGEKLDEYRRRLREEAGRRPIWQGLFDIEWRRRQLHAGKNDLVQNWSRLGFVVQRTKYGQTVLVESDRAPFDLLSFRECFYYLMNIEQYPEFVPKAMELAHEYLKLAAEVEPSLRQDPTTEQYGLFHYDAVTFAARLEKIYEAERSAAEKYNPTTGALEPLFRTPEQVVERIRQLGPFNQLDGSWLENIAKSGPIDDVHSFLFEIWSDEIGNGDPAQNHANVYTALMHSAGIYPPPINSRAYAEDPNMWEGSFSSPVYQSAIALFPEAFFPELLGMTLYLEWEAVFLPAVVKLYDYHGYNTLFYRLHVAIDNPVNGHGARAREAVVRYLDHVRAESGPDEMQEHFRRVWNGYLAFKFIGSEEWSYRFANIPTVDKRMIEMFVRKRRYAQMNHGTRKLGSSLLNDWLDEPDQFLKLLASSDLIAKGDARASRIFALMDPNGVMFKVFTPAERHLWVEWINSLPQDPIGGNLGAGESMEVLLNQFRARGIGVPEHHGYLLKGSYSDPAGNGVPQEVSKPLDWWFQIDQPRQFMEALSRPENGWVRPGSVAESRLVTELLSGPGRMARFLTISLPELGGKSARTIIINWIEAKCPIPAVSRGGLAQPASARTVAEARPATPVASSRARPSASDEYAREVVRTTIGSIRLSAEQRQGLQRRWYGPGGGACH